MFLALMISNIVLWLTLYLSVWLSDVLAPIFSDLGPAQWLSSIAASSCVGICIGRSYDIFIPVASKILPRRISFGTFSLAAFIVVGLLVLFSIGWAPQPPDERKNPSITLFLIVGLVGLVAFATHDTLDWLSPNDGSTSVLGLAVIIGLVLSIAAMLAPILIIDQVYRYYNAGLASCVAGWSAGLTSRQLKEWLGRSSLEARAGGSVVKGIVARDVSVIVAATIAYAAFKWLGLNPILFSVAVGVVGALVTNLIASVGFVD